MFQKILLLTLASSACTFIIGILGGLAIANQIPMPKHDKELATSEEVDYPAKIAELKQEIVKQSNLKQNCQATLNKLIKQNSKF